MNWFAGCDTVEAVKNRYRELMMENHPDKGGDVKVAQEINNAVEDALRQAMYGHYSDWQKANPEAKPRDPDLHVFAGILKKILDWNITIEVIGYWIYVFESYEYREQLKELGFWFSKKHKAWVYSGGSKRIIRSRMTTDQVRARHGSEHIRDREERERIA